MKKIFLIIFFFLIYFTSCDNNKCRNFYNFEYDYKVESYFKYPNAADSSLMKIDFFKDDFLLASLDRDGFLTKYVYDDQGVLVESYWGRQCGFSKRIVYKLDSFNNCIGEVYLSMRDTTTNIDTMQFRQYKFYDNQNRLTKELIDLYMYNDDFMDYGTWATYVYNGQKIESGYIIRDSIIIWKANYKYDSRGNLIEIEKRNDSIYEITKNKYDNKGLIIQKKITSNRSILTPKTLFSGTNYTEEYKYDSRGNLIEIEKRNDSIYEITKNKYDNKGLIIQKEITSNRSILTPETLFSGTNYTEEYKYDSSGFKKAEFVYNHRDELQHISTYKKIYRTPLTE